MNLGYIKRKLESLPKVIECGNHSGFPPCCIQFYSCNYMWMPEKTRQEYQDKINMESQHIGYVPCPSCLIKRNFVEVKKCPKNMVCRPGEWAEW